MIRKKVQSRNENVAGGKFSFALIVFVSLFVLTYIGFKISKQTYKQNEVTKEINLLQQEIDRLNQDNQNLNELLSYLQTSQYQEKEAKDKLNVIKESENLVLIKENDAQVAQEEPTDAGAQVVIERPNYYHWWYYFFSLKENS